MKFRNATISDLDQILSITKDAKEYLKLSGSSQWNEADGYPNKDTFINDINNNQLYLLEDNNKILGFEALIVGNEISYNKIDGSWLTNTTSSYLTIHRIAVSKFARGKHISSILINEAINLAKSNNLLSVRGDTHKLNIPMQHLFTSSNFQYCGIINLINNNYDNERLAYEYII